MPIAAELEEIVEIADDVNVKRDGVTITISGPNGEITKKFIDKRVNIDIGKDQIVLTTGMPTKREKAIIGTYASHLRNMVKGSTEDFTYKLKIIYSHFPVKVRAEGEHVVIENFIGEEKPRTAKILGETKANIQGDIITLSGPNKEEVGQTAANIEQATRIKNVDERVFQDGVYIIEKAGNPIR